MDHAFVLNIHITDLQKMSQKVVTRTDKLGEAKLHDIIARARIN